MYVKDSLSRLLLNFDDRVRVFTTFLVGHEGNVHS